MFKTFISTVALCAGLTFSVASPSTAAVIGSFDKTRTYQHYYLTGTEYSDLKLALETAGHRVRAATGVVTESYLSGLDVFFTGGLDIDPASPGTATTTSPGTATATELMLLKSWVMAGGTLVVGGDNSNFTKATNSWLRPITASMLEMSGGNVSGGTWATGPDPLLAGGVAGSSLGFVEGGLFASGSYDSLASYKTGVTAIARLGVGQGSVIALGDANFLQNGTSPTNRQFIVNVADNARVSIVPLPAGLPLLLAGITALALLRRRKVA